MSWALDEERRRNNTTMAIAAAVAVVLALVVFGTVTVLRRGDDRVIDQGSPASPVATAPVPTGLAGPSGSGGGDALTVQNVAWGDFGGAAVPVSAAGPRDMKDGRAFGFTRSQAGAVLAASNLIYRASSAAGPAVFRPTLAEQVVGVDKEKFLTAIEREHAQSVARGEVDPTSPEGVAATRALRSGVWAYRIDSYGPDAANVNVLLRSVPAGGPSFVNLALTVQWIDGDWRLLAGCGTRAR